MKGLMIAAILGVLAMAAPEAKAEHIETIQVTINNSGNYLPENTQITKLKCKLGSKGGYSKTVSLTWLYGQAIMSFQTKLKFQDGNYEFYGQVLDGSEVIFDDQGHQYYFTWTGSTRVGSGGPMGLHVELLVNFVRVW